MKVFIIFWLLSASAFGQNLVPTNPGAETGDLTGWTAQTVAYGAAQPNDSLNSVTVQSAANNLTTGSYSFHLHDGSSTTSEQMLSLASPSNRVQLNADTSYHFTFDIKLVDPSGTLNTPSLGFAYYNSATGGTVVETRAFDLLRPSDFSSTILLSNGFTRYTVTEYISSGGPSPLPTPLYCQFSFVTDIYPNSTSDMYVDNIVAIVVPEPGSLSYLLIIALVISAGILQRHFNLQKSVGTTI